MIENLEALLRVYQKLDFQPRATSATLTNEDHEPEDVINLFKQNAVQVIIKMLERHLRGDFTEESVPSYGMITNIAADMAAASFQNQLAVPKSTAAYNQILVRGIEAISVIVMGYSLMLEHYEMLLAQ